MKNIVICILIIFIFKCDLVFNQETQELLPSTLYNEIISNIQQSEYHISYDESLQAFQAPNRVNNFRSVFNEKGVRIMPRIMVNGNWFVTFEAQSIYRVRGESIELTNTKFAGNNGNIIDYNTRNILTTQYINLQQGLKSNYIINNKINGIEPLTLKIQLTTNLQYYLDDSGLYFIDNNQQIQLHYKDLFVYDSGNKVMNARFALDTYNNLLIIVDDSEAVYPLTIDPLSVTPAWAVEPNSADAYFGFALEGAGDVNADGFDDVIIGAQQYDNGSTDEGRAFLYLGSASGLATTHAWSAESNQASAYFGYCVRGAGDVNNDGFDDVIISAHYYDNGSTDEGRVFLYLGDPTGLQTTAAWTAEANQTGARFGTNMDGGADVNNDGYDDVLIAAPYYDFTATDEGRVYLYLGNASGLSATPSWNNYGNQTSAILHGVAFIGDVNNDGFEDAGTGAYQYDNGSIDEGIVYVFYNTGTGLPLTPSWSYEINKSSTKLGSSISAAGDVNGDGIDDFLAGAVEYDITSFDNHGKCLLFYGSISGLPLSPSWQLDGNYDDGRFGAIVAGVGDINGDNYDDFIASQPYFDDGTSGFAHKGRLLLFYGSPTGPGASYDWQFTGSTTGAEATNGFGAGFIGDVNNDGYNEIMIGSYSYSGGSTDEGRAQLFYGSPVYPEINPFATITGIASGASFGSVIKTLRDVNNDGYADLCIGAPFFDNGSVDEGKVFGYWGTASGFSPTANWSAEGNQDNANFGFSLDAFNDINNDGYSDLLIGAPGFDNIMLDQGRVYIYKGTTTGLYYLPSKIYTGAQTGAKLGYQLSVAGDMNADGFEDFIIGAPYYDDVITNQGVVYLYEGSISGFPITYSKFVLGDQAEAMFGSVISPTGDVNEDGFDDILISSPLFDNAFTNAGKVQLFKGGAGVTALTLLHTYEGNQASAQFGFALAGRGDINGDGIEDYAIGAPFNDNAQTDNGSVFLYYGGEIIPVTENWKVNGSTFNTQLGYAMHMQADYNGDGYEDIAITGLNDEINLNDEGLVNLYFGSIAGPRDYPSLAFSCNQSLAKFGNAITSIDIDNNGLSDYIIGAPNFDAAITDIGAAFIFMGTEDSCNILIDASAIGGEDEIHISCTLLSEPDLIAYRYRLLGDSVWSYGYSTTVAFSIPSLENCSIYQLALQPVCPSGSGDWLELTANTNGCLDDCALITIPGLTVEGLSSTSVSITWSMVPDVVDYIIVYRKSGAIIWNEVAATGSSTILNTLDSCSIYEFAIKANCIIDGPISDIVIHTTSICAEPCDAPPAGVFADGITPTSANIHWSPVFGATQYKVYYRPIGGSWSNVNSLSTTKTLTGLSSLTTYQCKVRANCPGLTSAFSTPITFTTPAKLEATNTLALLFPNPNNGTFIFTLPNTSDNLFEITITNLQGEVVHVASYTLENNTINLNVDLAQGVYQLHYLNNTINGTLNLVIVQ